MIDELKIVNFKCFENLKLEMSNLNVLAGINSMGKSSVIQALLLLRQTFDMSSINKGLIINGEATQLGTGFDLLFRDSGEDFFEINITSGNKAYKWRYEYQKDSDFQKLAKLETNVEMLEDINLFLPTFSYISAERIGPKRFYEKSYHQVHERNQVGYKGELFADYLSEKGFIEDIENKLVYHPKADSFKLIFQVEAWLSEISPGVHINAKNYSEAGIVGVGYKINNNDYTPMNVGFGISYVAPIVVSLLKAKSGDLVILENPEAHLHPKGQRKMGELIAKACAGGVQIIVETHSDHLLNGIRLSVKNKSLNRENIRINYFYAETVNDYLIHKKCSPAILEDGRLSEWPEGFFDEWDKAIDELF